MRIGEFMSEHMETGFASLDEVADAIAAYNPHRPAPDRPLRAEKNVRQRDDGRWYWHWDPRFMAASSAADETRASLVDPERLKQRGAPPHVPTLLVRGA